MAKKILLLILSVFMLTGASTLPYVKATDIDEDITIKSEDKVLVKDVDYTLEYKDNIKQGTATVIINFIGNYSGQAEQCFNIIRKSANSGGSSHSSISVNNKDNTVDTTKILSDNEGTNAVEHNAYINGYEDRTFKPDGDMSRAEAATIFARLMADEKGEKISGKASFKDVKSDVWPYSYIAYLEKYDILKGYEDKTFRPGAPVTRAEFVAISVRYYKLFNEVKDVADTTKYSDVNSGYWAVKDISIAKSIGWLNGYADGTFRGDNSITRAEAVTVINRATNRRADSEYINKNYTKLNRFTDITDNSQWFFADVMEAANDHMAVINSDGENWEK